jgi:DNA-binding transcriptional LysR family regulator
MDRQDIEMFQAILQEKNLTKAAHSLYLPPSTLGSRLKSLEGQLGVELIERKKGKKTVALTKYGEEFAAISQKMSILYKESDQLSGVQQNFPLTIGTVDGLLEHNLAGFYYELLSKSELFNLDVQLYPSNMIYPLVNKKEIDIGFIAYKMKFTDVEVEEFYSDDLVVVTPQDFPIEKSTIHPNSLDPAEELFIGSKNNQNVGWGEQFYAWHGQWFNKDVEPLLRANTISIVSYFLDLPKFWTIMPRATAVGFQKEKDVKVYGLEVPAPKRICYMLTHKQPSNHTKKMIDLFREELANYSMQ